MIELEETGYTTALCCVLYNKTISFNYSTVILLMCFTEFNRNGMLNELPYLQKCVANIDLLLRYSRMDEVQVLDEYWDNEEQHRR